MRPCLFWRSHHVSKHYIYTCIILYDAISNCFCVHICLKLMMIMESMFSINNEVGIIQRCKATWQEIMQLYHTAALFFRCAHQSERSWVAFFGQDERYTRHDDGTTLLIHMANDLTDEIKVWSLAIDVRESKCPEQDLPRDGLRKGDRVLWHYTDEKAGRCRKTWSYHLLRGASFAMAFLIKNQHLLILI